MKDEMHTKQKKISAIGAWTAVTVLLICVLMTSAVVGACIELFAYAKEPDTVISILPPTEEKAKTLQKSMGTVALFANNTATHSALSLKPSEGNKLANSSPSFYVSDDKQIWGSKTDIDIFHAFYENDEGIITVKSKNGDKVVAPGTTNTYLFYITNDGDAAVDYEMLVTATLSDNLKKYTVPVLVRLSDETGTWMCGDEDTWKNFTELDGTRKKAVLGANSYSAYSLEWEWPFESGDDPFDTFLGDLAVNEDLWLTITISLIAEYDDDPNAPGGTPGTGDNSQLMMWILLILLSFTGLIITLKHLPQKSEV